MYEFFFRARTPFFLCDWIKRYLGPRHPKPAGRKWTLLGVIETFTIKSLAHPPAGRQGITEVANTDTKMR